MLYSTLSGTRRKYAPPKRRKIHSREWGVNYGRKYRRKEKKMLNEILNKYDSVNSSTQRNHFIDRLNYIIAVIRYPFR